MLASLLSHGLVIEEEGDWIYVNPVHPDPEGILISEPPRGTYYDRWDSEYPDEVCERRYLPPFTEKNGTVHSNVEICWIRAKCPQDKGTPQRGMTVDLLAPEPAPVRMSPAQERIANLEWENASLRARIKELETCPVCKR
jgi:hypothetical protein